MNIWCKKGHLLMSFRFLSAKSDKPKKPKKPKKPTQVLPRTAPPWFCFFWFFWFFWFFVFFWFLFFSLLFVMQKIFVCWSNVCQRVEFLHLPKVCLDWHAFYVHFAHARGPLFWTFNGLGLPGKWLYRSDNTNETVVDTLIYATSVF